MPAISDYRQWQVLEDGRVVCPLCNEPKKAQGISSHVKTCSQHYQDADDAAAFEESIDFSADDLLLEDDPDVAPWERPEMLASPRPSAPTKGPMKKAKAAVQQETNIPGAPVSQSASSKCPEKDTIRTEYHPQSKRNVKVKEELFEDYKEYDQPNIEPSATPKPWKPFGSKSDFEFAEIAQDAHLNSAQIDRLLKVFQQCLAGRDTLNFRDSKHLKEAWSHACALLPSFEKYTLEAKHEGISESYDIYSRSIWDWAMSLLDDPHVAKDFEWDARRLFKYDGKKYERFIHEPWTADSWWNVQSELPPGASPLFFILYADKKELSSFGTKKGYPVFAKIANLPGELRNGRGYTGGRLVGWLPVISEDPELSHKVDYVNFKRVVWHESFKRFLASIKDRSFNGFHKQCADGHGPRHIFPIILALSADFEEQSVMALTRGSRGDFPCPVCLVPGDQLYDQAVKAPLRNMDETRSILKSARKLAATSSIGEAQALLKEYSLKDIHNAFWDIQHSDPHKILSFDHMHNHSHGLGGKHLWVELKVRIGKVGKAELKIVQNRAAEFPRWRDLHHFFDIISESFTDAKKLEDVVRLAPFISHSILTKAESKLGYLLLCCIRSYLILDAYLVMDVQTETTIREGEEELQVYGRHMQRYIDETEDTNAAKTLEDVAKGKTAEAAARANKTKKWSFPKNHMHVHAFDDIRSKGVVSVYNTLHNEPLHGPLKDAYINLTNFKDVDAQILRADQERFVAQYLRNTINRSEEIEAEAQKAKAEDPKRMQVNDFGNIKLGSAENQVTVDQLLLKLGTSDLFKHFRSKLTAFLSHHLSHLKLGHDLLKVEGPSKITEYRLIRAHYESRVTWRTSVDILRCNSEWKSGPRRDCVMVDTTEGVIFAQLIFVFTIKIAKVIYPIALVLPFGYEVSKSKARQKKDADMQFLRVRKPKDVKAEFVSARSVIRGAVLVPSYDFDDEYIVFDVLDSDLVVRVRDILKNCPRQS